MNSNIVKLCLFFFISFSIPAFSQNGSENVSSDKIDCGLHDCTLECLADGRRTNSYGGAKSITTEFLSGGIIRYTIDRGMNGRQIVLVGPNSYICTINKE